MIIATEKQNPITMEIVTDPVELAKARELDARFELNWAWFEAHAPEIYQQHRGKVYCVAGQELFVADLPAEVLALARAAHPEDNGRLTGIIRKDRSFVAYLSLSPYVCLRCPNPIDAPPVLISSSSSS